MIQINDVNSTAMVINHPIAVLLMLHKKWTVHSYKIAKIQKQIDNKQ